MSTATSTNWVVDIAIGDTESIESEVELNTREEAIAYARKMWASNKSKVTAVEIVSTLDGEVETLWVKPTPFNEIPASGRGIHYAVNGKRYIVRRATKGKWEGWTFLSTGSEYNEQKTLAMVRPNGSVTKSTDASVEILAAIAANPAERMKEFGDITGSCARCGRVLEDEESRARGLGPICAGKI